MFIYSKKDRGVGRALARRATKAANFNGVVQLAPSDYRPAHGALELPETWEIGGPRRAHGHI